MSKLVVLSSALVMLTFSHLSLAQDAKVEKTAAEIDWRLGDQLSSAQRAELPYFCQGRYVEPKLQPLSANPSLSSSQINATAITGHYAKDRELTLTGDVILTQGSQEVRAPKVVQDEASQISNIDGPLQIRQSGMLITGEHATSNLAEGTGTVEQATFLVHAASMRGKAAQLIQAENGHILLNDATLTRCDPGSNLWTINSKDVELEPENGFGTARNLTIRIKDVPILYTPYIRFPINDERQSGFLLPSIGSDSDGGTDINIPYYFNFDPQYDATYQLRSMWKRGLVHDVQGRHKSEKSTNEVNLAFLGSDDVFDDRAVIDATSSGTDTSSTPIPPFKKQDRWLLNLRHDAGWTSRWKTHLSYSAVSDIQYLHDIGGNVGSSAIDDYINPVSTSLTNRRSAALDRVGQVQYRGEGWNAALEVRGFQNLDVNGGAQYEKLPEFKADWKEKFGPIETSSKFNYTFFEKRNTGAVIGERAYIDLEAAWPLRASWGFVKPSLGVVHRKYQLDDTAATGRANPEETTPRLSIDSGLYFDRYFKLGDANLQQTLEPRLYYLYVEEDQQDDLPAFDAAASTLSYSSIFRHNRFSGYDRIGDARQVALGITSRFLSEDTGAEFLSASIGQIYYLKDRKVSYAATAADNPLASESALFTQARLNFGNGLTMNGVFEWDPDVNRSNRGGFSLKYASLDQRKLVNVNYSYIASEIQASSLTVKSEETNVNFIWPVKGNWSAIGMWNFGWDDNRTIESFYGLEYNDCCWKTRLIVRRFLKGPRSVSVLVDDPTSASGFKTVSNTSTPADTGIFFEFQLKGLATLGRRLDSLLEDAIPGYRDREDKIGL